MTSEMAVVGRPAIRKDALAKATGEALYAADVVLPNVRVGKVLRSPYDHASIERIEVDRARELPGVIAVVTAADVPGHLLFGPLLNDRPALAHKVVRHIGEPVAIVVADSPRDGR